MERKKPSSLTLLRSGIERLSMLIASSSPYIGNIAPFTLAPKVASTIEPLSCDRKLSSLCFDFEILSCCSFFFLCASWFSSTTFNNSAICFDGTSFISRHSASNPFLSKSVLSSKLLLLVALYSFATSSLFSGFSFSSNICDLNKVE